MSGGVRRGRGMYAALALPLVLSGCGIMPMKRHLPVPKPPARVQTATPEELVDALGRRWNEFQNLTATVEMRATLLSRRRGWLPIIHLFMAGL